MRERGRGRQGCQGMPGLPGKWSASDCASGEASVRTPGRGGGASAASKQGRAPTPPPTPGTCPAGCRRTLAPGAPPPWSPAPRPTTRRSCGAGRGGGAAGAACCPGHRSLKACRAVDKGATGVEVTLRPALTTVGFPAWTARLPAPSMRPPWPPSLGLSRVGGACLLPGAGVGAGGRSAPSGAAPRRRSRRRQTWMRSRRASGGAHVSAGPGRGALPPSCWHAAPARPGGLSGRPALLPATASSPLRRLASPCDCPAGCWPPPLPVQAATCPSTCLPRSRR